MSTTAETKPQTKPSAKGSLVPYIMVSDANAASLFYQRAFGAEEVARRSCPRMWCSSAVAETAVRALIIEGRSGRTSSRRG